MPRLNTQTESLQKWTRFNPADSLHVPLIKEFGDMIVSKFNGSFEEYCKKRHLIGKKPYINEDGRICGVQDFYEKDSHRIYFTRLPYPYLEDQSKWEAYQELKTKKISSAELPF